MNLPLSMTHGTATLFNDQMESVALQHTELIDVLVNALKGYIGHTLGAAGIFETILCMKSVDDHIILGTRGYEELGVSGRVRMSLSIVRLIRRHSSRCCLALEGAMLRSMQPQLRNRLRKDVSQRRKRSEALRGYALPCLYQSRGSVVK